MTPYLVCSTPRSGSAWLANFLSSGDCLCVHEPLLHAPPARGYRVVGGVDTGAAFFVDQIRAQMPEVRLYQLVRDPAAVGASLQRLGLPWSEYPELDLPTFRYEELFSVPYLMDVWTELNGPGFDPLRAEMLIETNVQRSIAALERRLQEKR